MMQGGSGWKTTPSLFSERLKNFLGKFFTLIIGAGSGHDIDAQEEDDDNEKVDFFWIPIELQ